MTKIEVIDSTMLASLDEARVYNAASSYNWLNAKLREFYAVVQNGGRVQVEDNAEVMLLDSKTAFVAWAMDRYPMAEFGQSKILVMVVSCFRHLFRSKLGRP